MHVNNFSTGEANGKENGAFNGIWVCSVFFFGIKICQSWASPVRRSHELMKVRVGTVGSSYHIHIYI